MKPGDIILTFLPQSDGVRKNRPAVILCQVPPFRDYLVCGISTQLRQAAPDLDELISQDDSDFADSGLVAPSIVRVGYLSIVAIEAIKGAVGQISRARLRRILDRLSAFFKDHAHALDR